MNQQIIQIMALNSLLITIDDVRQFRDVDTQFASARFNGFLRQIQTNDLKQLLGSELWYDFLNRLTEDLYQRLLDGGFTYQVNGEDIYYPGLKPFLCWAWLSKLPLESDLHHTQSGETSYLREFTGKPSGATLLQAKEEYKNSMLISRNDVVLFLNENTNIYTLWNQQNTRKQSDYLFDII